MGLQKIKLITKKLYLSLKLQSSNTIKENCNRAIETN